MDIMKFIVEQALILIPALYVLGMILKNLQMIPDKFIPVILLAFGIAGAVSIMGLSPQSIIQGILVTGAAVYTNQLIKQMQEKF